MDNNRIVLQVQEEIPDTWTVNVERTLPGMVQIGEYTGKGRGLLECREFTREMEIKGQEEDRWGIVGKS